MGHNGRIRIIQAIQKDEENESKWNKQLMDPKKIYKHDRAFIPDYNQFRCKSLTNFSLKHRFSEHIESKT